MFMVKKKASTKHHKRRIRYPVRGFGTSGYVFLTMSWLLTIGTAGTLLIDKFRGKLDSTYEYIPPLTRSYGSEQVTESHSVPFLLEVLLLMLLVCIVLLLAHFIAVHTSSMLKHFLKAIGAKITLGLLLGIKATLALLAVLAQMVVVLALPEGSELYMYIVVGMTSLLAALSVASFAFQHGIARHAKMAVKNIL